jgi:hypothetical protein
MKNIIISIILSILFIKCFAQSVDSVFYQSKNILLTQNLETGRYKLITNQTYDELNFARRINRYFQILDVNNQVFFIGEDGVKKKEVKDYISVCGTVPHFTLSIKKTESYFEIFEDETFYDYNNEIPAEKKQQVSIQEADSVLFINGKTDFNFTSNFDVGIGTTDPRMLILVKNGKYYSKDNHDLKFDSIYFTKYYHSLKTMKNNLYGLLGIIEPKYKRIEDFNYYLAKAETENGEVVYIDIEGNEYKSVVNKK